MFHKNRHTRAIYSLVDTNIIMCVNENIPRDVLSRFLFIKYIIKDNGEISNGGLARGEVVRYLVNVFFNLRADSLISEKMQLIVRYRSAEHVRYRKQFIFSCDP